MYLPHFFDCFYGTFLNAYHASLAVVIIRVREAVLIYRNATVRTPDNAGHAPGTGLVIPDRLKYPPVAGLS